MAKKLRGLRFPGLPDTYEIPGVYISATEPVASDAKLWINPYGNKNGLCTYDCMYGVVSAVLNDVFISTAARYATIADALAESNATADGKVLAYTNGGMLNIILTEDVTDSEIITVTKDCTIHLNGHELAFAAGKHLLLTSGKLTIDGTVPGSKIAKDTANGSAEFLLSVEGVEGTRLHLVGGIYSATGTAATAILPIRAKDGAVTEMTLSGCVVIAKGSAGTLIAGAQLTDDTTIDHCTFDVESDTCQGCAINARNHNYALTVRNSTFITKGNTQIVKGISLSAPAGVVENCTFFTVAGNESVECQGIETSSSCSALTVTNCHVESDGYGDAAINAISAAANTEVTINGGYYRGASQALNVLGVSHINDGVFEDGSRDADFEIGTTTFKAILSVKDESGNWVGVC